MTSPSYFYAAESRSELLATAPSLFEIDAFSLEAVPVPPSMLFSERGVWLLRPVTSDPDENGEVTVVSPGERSAPYVLLSSKPVTAWAPFAISPEGLAGFA